MSIYAIGDLHLSFQTNKPMDIFGEQWKDYEEKIKNNWKKEINNNDLVILLGDFSWAMKLEETILDFKFIHDLPGIKVLIKGNHDYWWTSITKMNNLMQENKFYDINFIQNNAFYYKDYAIIGTRGWTFSDSENATKMLNRELIRLENSILDIKNREEKRVICAMHYPPITLDMINKNEKSPYIELLNKYNINNCYYGHLHGKSHIDAVEGEIDGVNLKLLSSDYIDFKPEKIAD